jgi:hypothetical protein
MAKKTVNKGRKKTTFYRDIETFCDIQGISVSKLCKKAKVNRGLIEKWKYKEPKSLVTFRKMNRAMMDDYKKSVTNIFYETTKEANI